MNEIISSFSFWLGIFIPIIMTILIMIAISKYWIGTFDKSSSQEEVLSAASFREPINMGITVTTILIPIILGLVSYLSKTESYRKLSLLFSIITLCIVSIFVGLWNSYSLATATNKDGAFKITLKDNLYFPAFFVSQLFLLFFGLFLLIIFCFSYPSIQSVKGSSTNINGYLIQRPILKISMNIDKVIELWGTPSSQKKQGSTTTLIYNTDISEITILIENFSIVSIIETKY